MRITTTSGHRQPAASPERADCWVVLLLCVVAGLRVLVYSAVFPFFNNVDEVAHFDLVVKYSHREVPRGFEPLSLETGEYIARYASPEYLSHAEPAGDTRVPPPPWTRSRKMSADLAQKAASWQAVTNPESSQAPLYYALAALWMNLGRVCVPPGGWLLYWIRFLNVPLIGALIWLAFVASRTIFPERRFLRLGVPALLAFLPQSAFDSIQNDVLSPICFGIAFLGLVRLLRDDRIITRGTGLMTGLALAATGFVKVSNLPLLVVAAAAITFRAWQLARARKLRPALPALALLGISAGVPLAGLAIWNQAHYGDLTGSAGKIALLGWTRKPFDYWWIHPIFSITGLWGFWHELTASFWRGEIVWFGQRLASKPVDHFYSISSALVAGAGAASLLRKFTWTTHFQGPPLWLSLGCCLASVGFLAGLSIAFDFGDGVYPSREHPFLVSGRLLSGVMIPFALLYVLGLDRLFNRGKSDRLKWFALAGVILIAAVSEVVINRPVFSSQYNLFHM